MYWSRTASVQSVFYCKTSAGWPHLAITDHDLLLNQLGTGKTGSIEIYHLCGRRWQSHHVSETRTAVPNDGNTYALGYTLISKKKGAWELALVYR